MARAAGRLPLPGLLPASSPSSSYGREPTDGASSSCNRAPCVALYMAAAVPYANATTYARQMQTEQERWYASGFAIR